MSNIEIGEYVRTNRGIITKVIDFRKETCFRTNRGTISHSPARYYFKSEKVYSLTEPYIKAHSFNIIDLIEIGDYVGNCEIQYIHKNEKGETLLENDNVTLTEKDIKTIVTKEQFDSVRYEVE